MCIAKFETFHNMKEIGRFCRKHNLSFEEGEEKAWNWLFIEELVVKIFIRMYSSSEKLYNQIQILKILGVLLK